MPLRWIACAAVLSAGCSIAFVRPPPQGARPNEIPRCTLSRTAPIADAVLLAGAGLVLFAGLAGSDRPDPSASVRLGSTEVTIASALVGIVFAISAWYGFSGTAECRELMATTPARR